MASKLFAICTFACLIQIIAGRCYSPTSSPCSSSSACVSIDVPDNGGALRVTSVGPIAPSGLALATDLGLAGDLVVTGTLPYLSAVAFEGQFETNGVTPITYGCGDCVAITQEINSGNPVSVSSVRS